MKKRHSLLYNILLFVFAQLFWLMLLGLWIYWYVSNYIIFKNVGDQVAPQLIYDATNVFPLVGGIILLVAISVSMSLIFRHLSVQLKLTKMYDNFIANVTHELKSPLSSIQLYLETLNSRNVPEEKKEEFYGLMIKDTDRLNKLINSILEISAIDRKNKSTNFNVYEADSLVRKIINESKEIFKLSQADIVISGKVNCKCRFDENSMRILINNLVDNAVKYSNDKVKIEITLREYRNNFLIEFSDSGIGIPQNEQKKIFNKFYRINNKNIPSVKGTGLGLFWVKEIIKKHKGKIFVVNSEKDSGTTFRIEFPVYFQGNENLIKKLFSNFKHKELNNA